ncbi:hypothetical protein NFI96_018378 [Prochilodus magdalenae]|nr:hypothetical protein NFI96_018378 [Prochilodus magdalenae]
MLRTVRVNPQTSTKDLQHDFAADGVTVYRSAIQHTLHKKMLYGRVMQRKPFLRPHHKQSRLSSAEKMIHQGSKLISSLLRLQLKTNQKHKAENYQTFF